jgi:hypothetical protein
MTSSLKNEQNCTCLTRLRSFFAEQLNFDVAKIGHKRHRLARENGKNVVTKRHRIYFSSIFTPT